MTHIFIYILTILILCIGCVICVIFNIHTACWSSGCQCWTFPASVRLPLSNQEWEWWFPARAGWRRLFFHSAWWSRSHMECFGCWCLVSGSCRPYQETCSASWSWHTCHDRSWFARGRSPGHDWAHAERCRDTHSLAYWGRPPVCHQFYQEKSSTWEEQEVGGLQHFWGLWTKEW